MAEREPEVPESLGSALQDLLVAAIRFSTAVDLYALEQIEKTIETIRGDGLPAGTERYRNSLDTVSDTLEDRIDDTKKEALRSMSRVAAKALDKYFEYASPAAILRNLSDWNDRVSRASSPKTRAEAKPNAPESPRLAVDVLAGPPV